MGMLASLFIARRLALCVRVAAMLSRYVEIYKEHQYLDGQCIVADRVIRNDEQRPTGNRFRFTLRFIHLRRYFASCLEADGNPQV